MAIINIFKKGDKKDKMTKIPAKGKITAEKTEEKTVSPMVKSNKPAAAGQKKELDRIYRIIKNPHITEKATILGEKNQYVFKIEKRANKTEVKKAVEDYYGVSVLAVRIINIPERVRRRGKGFSIKKGYKKAIVAIPAEQKIEVLPR